MCVGEADLRQQRSSEGDLVVSGESWLCTGSGGGWRTSSSSLTEAKGMERLISLKLLKEHVLPLQDTHAYRYVQQTHTKSSIYKRNHLCSPCWSKLLFLRHKVVSS